MWAASGNVRQHLVAEHLLALVDVHVDEALAERRQLDVGVLELGEAQQLQGLAEREQVVDLELQRVGEMRQVGVAVIGRRGDLLEHAGERVGRDARQRQAKADRRCAASRVAGFGGPGAASSARRSCRRAARNSGSSRSRGCGSVTGISAAMRPGLEDSTRMRSHISTASSMLCVTIRIDFDRHAPFVPEVEQVGAQGLGGQHVERRERLVHQEDLRLHDERAREADALAHAARQLLRIGGFEAVEADGVDRLQRALAGLVERHAIGAQARSRHCRARRARETARSSGTPWRLPSPGPSTGLPPIVTVPCGRAREPGDDAQQRRLAAAGAAEQRDDLAGLQASARRRSRTGAPRFARACCEALADVARRRGAWRRWCRAWAELPNRRSGQRRSRRSA